MPTHVIPSLKVVLNDIVSYRRQRWRSIHREACMINTEDATALSDELEQEHTTCQTKSAEDKGISSWLIAPIFLFVNRYFQISWPASILTLGFYSLTMSPHSIHIHLSTHVSLACVLRSHLRNSWFVCTPIGARIG